MTQTRDELRPLLDFLKRSRGFDFTGYKRSTLERRLHKRMDLLEIEGYGGYLDFLQVHPSEFGQLFDTMLINVTSFFRDATAWDYLDEEVLPGVIAQADGRELRVWSAGCASGEEAYTISMLLVRHLGEEAFRERVKVYATDVDEDALGTARLAAYTAKQVETVPGDLVERCFDVDGNGGFSFRKDLRRSLIFGRNDLVQDAPISRIDVLICRNVLMYFNAEIQARALNRFNFALSDHGVLFLGKSEMLLTHGDLFRPVDLKWRIFSKVPRTAGRERLPFVAGDPEEPPLAVDDRYPRVRDAAFDLAPVAQLIVDRAGGLAGSNQHARSLFGLVPSDVGRPLQDLEISYRPVELRSAIEEAYTERRTISLGTVRWTPASGEERRYDVHVVPIQSDGGAMAGASVSFNDVTSHAELREELEVSKRDLETAYEELQSTVEELETTNEELQSTNEELETTNEELQSTNEELETMNEELQSSNEELETMNDELRERSLELNEVNAFQEAIVDSLDVGVVVVDRGQLVRAWSRRAQDLWGLRSDEAMGEHFLNLDMGLPTDRLKSPLRAAIAGERAAAPTIVTATTRLGRTISCAVTFVPLTGGYGVGGAVMLMEERKESG